MAISSFLPKYPDPDDDTFYQELFERKEFNILRPNPQMKRTRAGFVPQPQQLYESRYASYHTMYDRQLIVHSMGLGKTALAILTAEKNLESGYYTGVVIAVSEEKKFSDTFIREIKLISGQKYYPLKWKSLTADQLNAAIKKKILLVYSFISYTAFSSNIMEYVANADFDFNNYLKINYANKVIILDEVHNTRTTSLKESGKEGSMINKAFNIFLHNVPNSKIILMTGTPMKDKWNEIADVMNLILPLDRQLPTGPDFDSEYGNNGESVNNQDKLKSYLRGYVSTLKTAPSDVKREYVGTLVPTLKVFHVDISTMSKLQTASYISTLASSDVSEEEETKKRGFSSSSRQASNFVFPDGSYGSDGFKKNMVESKNKGLPKFKDNVLKFFKGDTDEDILQKIEMCSSKYASTIRNILKQRETGEGSTFVYNEFVNGSGCIVFANLLRLFGYSRSKSGQENTVAKRYVIIASEYIAQNVIVNTQRTFTDPKNVKGDYIQVIIGSRTASEGLSFANIGAIEIHTPWWNYTPVDQAIGRGIRYRSHVELLKLFPDFKVKIYHKVAMPRQEGPQPIKSIDLQMYEISEYKDVRIKLGERLLKEVSYDCANNSMINKAGIDYTRDCEYKTCDYKCEGITDSNPVLDHTNYNLFYSDEEVNDIIEDIKTLFRTSFIISLEKIRSKIVAHPTLHIQALKKIIDNNINITNKFGYISYLREFRDLYFLVDGIESHNTFLDAYYTENGLAVQDVNFRDIIIDVQYTKSEEYIDIMCKGPENYKKYWAKLSIDIKEMILIDVIEAEEAGAKEGKEFRKWVLNLVDANIFRLGDNRIVITMSQTLCRIGKDKWIDCEEDDMITSEISGIQKKVKDRLLENSYGYYATINKQLFDGPDGHKHGFWISTISEVKGQVGNDKRKQVNGEKCTTGSLLLGKLASIAFELGFEINNTKHDKVSPDLVRSLQKRDESDTRKTDKNIYINLYELSDKELVRFYKLYKHTAKNLCMDLADWFKKNDLVIYTDKTDMKRKT